MILQNDIDGYVGNALLIYVAAGIWWGDNMAGEVSGHHDRVDEDFLLAKYRGEVDGGMEFLRNCKGGIDLIKESRRSITAKSLNRAHPTFYD